MVTIIEHDNYVSGDFSSDVGDNNYKYAYLRFMELRMLCRSASCMAGCCPVGAGVVVGRAWLAGVEVVAGVEAVVWLAGALLGWLAAEVVAAVVAGRAAEEDWFLEDL